MKSFILLAFFLALSAAAYAQAPTTVDPTYVPWFDCQGEADYLFNHPCDCTKFIHCAWGRGFWRQCDNPLVFSESIQMCDWRGSEFPVCAPQHPDKCK